MKISSLTVSSIADQVTVTVEEDGKTATIILTKAEFIESVQSHTV